MQTASILTPALEALGKPEWADFFGSFLNNFSHMPPMQYADAGESVEVEVLNLLWSIVEPAKLTPDLAVHYAAIRISKLPIFTLRAYHSVGGQRVYWHPLQQTFSSFQTPDTVIAQAHAAYPAEDIIKRWVRDNLK